MIIPNSYSYDKIKQEINKETIDRFDNADEKITRNDKLYRYDSDLAEEIEVEYVYRAISQDELDFIDENGFIKSNQSNNIGYEKEQSLTCYKDTFPGNYLPEEGGYIIKVKVEPENHFFYDDVDEYVKTEEKVPAEQIVKIYGDLDEKLTEKESLLNLIDIYKEMFNLND